LIIERALRRSSAMKRLIAAVILFASFTGAQAGSFGGPPPFTNGSPLTSGVQGTYQASARGDGISGTIRFTYGSNGNPSTTNNTYVFFVDGVIISGTVQASIMTSRLAGVLEAPTVGTIPSPGTAAVNEVTSTGGYFSGKFKTNSPNYSFNGNGSLQVFTFPTGGTYYDSSLRGFRIAGVRTSLN